MNEEQMADLVRLKRHRPYMIVWGALSPDGKWEVYATPTRHRMMSLARKGWRVWELQV